MIVNNIFMFIMCIKEFIDEFKLVCVFYGLGNDGNEFKIISQIFLYKFLNDCFVYEIKQFKLEFKDVEDWEK